MLNNYTQRVCGVSCYLFLFVFVFSNCVELLIRSAFARRYDEAI